MIDNNIKEIRLCWDWQTVVIPKEYLKEFTYELKQNSDNTELNDCSKLKLVMDLDYLKSHKVLNGYMVGLEEGIEDDTLIINLLSGLDIWFIKVIYNDDSSKVLDLPSYRMNSTLKTTDWFNCFEKNTCEKHQILSNSYVIEWQYPKLEEVYMNKETSLSFLQSIFLTHHLTYDKLNSFELFEYLLKLKGMDDNTLNQAKKDIYTICDNKYQNYVLPKTITQECHYTNINNTDLIEYKIHNKSSEWLLNFIFVNDLTDLNNLLDLKIINDTTNTFSSNILIVNDNQTKDKVLSLTKKLNLTLTKLIIITMDEFNQAIYDIRLKGYLY